MGDENQPCTLGEYSKPSHEGYRNNIKLHEEANVSLLRSDTIQLVQNGCELHKLWSEDPNQHLKDFINFLTKLTLMVHLERQRACVYSSSLFTIKLAIGLNHGKSLYDLWTRFKELLQKVPHYAIDLWLQIQIFHEHVSYPLQREIDHAASGKLHEKNAKESWAIIKYQANPKESHLIAVKRIFRCLKAMSSTEAEYVAAAGYCANILWMKSQLTDYDIIYEKPLDKPSFKRLIDELAKRQQKVGPLKNPPVLKLANPRKEKSPTRPWPPISTPVDIGMHKEDQQETDGPTYLEVTSKERSNPQLSSGLVAVNLNKPIYSASFIIHSDSASGNDASVVSITEADLGNSAPSDFIPQHQGMNERTKNTSYDHLYAGTGPHVLADQTKSLEDLAKLVSHVQPSFKDLDSLEDDLVIVMDDSDEDEEDEVHATGNSQKHKLELENNKAKAEAALLKAQPSFPNVEYLNQLLVKSFKTEFSNILLAHDFTHSLPTELKDLPSKFNELNEEVKGLKKQVHELEIELPRDFKEILTKLEDFTKTVASVQAKLKSLDALLSLLLNVTKALNKLAQVLDNALSKDRDQSTSKSQPKSTGKSAQVEEIVFEAGDTQGPQNLREDTGNTDEPPVVNVDPKDWFKKPERPPTPDPEWNKGKLVENKPTQKWLSDLAKEEKPSRTFIDFIITLIDFSAFVMNRLQISEITQYILVGLAYNILKDWNNPEGDRYPFDLSKPPPLVMSGNCQIEPVDYFFNNDLAYLQGGSTRRTYTTSLTKTMAGMYDLPGIEDMGPKRQRFYGYASNGFSKHDVYSTKIILTVTNVKVKEWYGYGHLEEIEVRRSD
ncbi:hypothetical protein Tco_1010136 [Tanacetum coccineum]